jgi:SPP1 gp7 family putative phage head morphogenesis protein
MPRLTVKQRELISARVVIEQALAQAIYKELSFTWRRLYPSIRRLDRQRPVFKADGITLRKATFAGGLDLWERFKAGLNARIIAELSTGIITLNQIHNLHDQKYSLYQPVDIDPAQLVAAHRVEIGQFITDTTDTIKRKVGLRTAYWYNDGEQTLGDLVHDLQTDFSERRAQTIAMTETTWLNSVVTYHRMDVLGEDRWIWQSLRDEITCNRCREKHGKVFSIHDPMPPGGSHPACRCSPVPIPSPESIHALQIPNGLTI